MSIPAAGGAKDKGLTLLFLFISAVRQLGGGGAGGGSPAEVRQLFLKEDFRSALSATDARAPLVGGSHQ